jgi:hypothetical protein
MAIILKSRRPGADKFSVRNRWNDHNTAMRAGHMSRADMLLYANDQKHRWQDIEPRTEFLVVDTDKESRVPRASPPRRRALAKTRGSIMSESDYGPDDRVEPVLDRTGKVVAFDLSPGDGATSIADTLNTMAPHAGWYADDDECAGPAEMELRT